MKTNTIITAYAITITAVLLAILVWRAGYASGQADTVERVERTLNEQMHKPHLGYTFDAMCNEFAAEFK